MKFLLHKWYLDCTAPDGQSAILYIARLTWGLLRLPYAACLVVRPDGRVEVLGRYSRKAAVEREGGTLRVRAPAVGMEGTWVATLPPLEVELLASEAGSIRWRCRQPGGTASLRLPGGASLTGAGYAEEIELGIAPWSLPFRELRWGRFLGGGRSLVWIDWSEGLTKRWVFVDGQPVSVPPVRQGGIDWPGGRLELERGTRSGRDRSGGSRPGDGLGSFPAGSGTVPSANG